MISKAKAARLALIARTAKCLAGELGVTYGGVNTKAEAALFVVMRNTGVGSAVSKLVTVAGEQVLDHTDLVRAQIAELVLRVEGRAQAAR